jgi:hypothetical protein
MFSSLGQVGFDCIHVYLKDAGYGLEIQSLGQSSDDLAQLVWRQWDAHSVINSG